MSAVATTVGGDCDELFTPPWPLLCDEPMTPEQYAREAALDALDDDNDPTEDLG